MRLLVIEDEEKLGENLKKVLDLKGYAVDLITDGEQGLSRILLYKDEYDLILLDLGLPDIDGSTITEKVRKEGVTTPIIVLTGRDKTEHKVDLLNSGADDYVVKPFSFQELLARINAVLRRPTVATPTVLKVGSLQMNMSLRVVTRDEVEIPLTLKEFSLLEYFMRQPNETIPRDELFEHVWDFNSLRWSNVLDVHMKNLRKKLTHEDSDYAFETVRGIGYRLTEKA